MVDIRSSIPSGNHGGSRRVPIDTIVFHHIVGDAPAAISRFRQPGVQVSSTYIIGSDGQVYYTVDESQIPYTNGDAGWNRRSITIEHAGGHAQVPYTEKMYQASITLCRDLFKRHKITQIKRHRDIKSTACPGNLDVERIVREAKQGDNNIMDELAAKELYRVGLHREPENDQVWRPIVGKRPAEALVNLKGSQEWLFQNHITKVGYAQSNAEIERLKKELASDNDIERARVEEVYNNLGKVLGK